MFGAASPTNKFGGFPSAPSATAAPAGGGGFPGAGSTIGGPAFGTPAPAASGWGAKPMFPATSTTQLPQQQQQTNLWGTQPQQQQQPQTMNLWGGQAQQQQQQQPGNMWGGMQQQQQQPLPVQQNTVVYLRDFEKQSALASLLNELDRAYDALGPRCRFRTFAYTVCPPGRANDAIQRERYIAFLHKGGVPDEDWREAQMANPNPSRLYPQPLHFVQELQQRCDKQKAELKRLTDAVDEFLKDAEAVAARDEANKSRLRAMQQEDIMLRRRWYVLQQKLEVLGRLGQRSGDEALLLRQVQQLRQVLGRPGVYRDALQDLQPLLDSEAEAYAAGPPTNSSGLSTNAAPLRSRVDLKVIEGWVAFAGGMQDAIESLHDLLKKDNVDMDAICSRIAQ